MRAALGLVMLGTLVHSATVNVVPEVNKTAQIAFAVPRAWVIDNEQTLTAVGFIVPPMPLYALVASPTKTPASVALNASAVPWLFVTVETDHDLLPAPQLYELAPEYLESLASQSGNPVTAVKVLVPHRSLQEGGLTGSTAALTVVSPMGNTSLDELAYEKGNQIWMVIAGCSSACYDENRTTIMGIVAGVRVGSAARGAFTAAGA
jgi:hypothetical protein